MYIQDAVCCNSGGTLAPAGTTAQLSLVCSEAVRIAPSCFAVWGPPAGSAVLQGPPQGTASTVHRYTVEWNAGGPQYQACVNISIPLRCGGGVFGGMGHVHVDHD